MKKNLDKYTETPEIKKELTQSVNLAMDERRDPVKVHWANIRLLTAAVPLMSKQAQHRYPGVIHNLILQIEALS